MWEVTCVCGMCRDVYVDVCLNTYGHAHVCVCLWRPEVDAGSFFFSLSLFHLTHQDRVSVKVRARWHWQVLLASLLWGFFVSASPNHKLSCLPGTHMASGLSTSIFPVVWRTLSQVTSPQFLRQGLSLNLKHIFPGRRAGHWPPGLRSQVSVAVLDFYTGVWGSKLRSSCL